MPPRKPLPPYLPTDVIIHDYPVGIGKDGKFILLCSPVIESFYLHQLPQMYDNQQAEKEARREARAEKKQAELEAAQGTATVDADGRKVQMWWDNKFIPIVVRGQHGSTKELLVTVPATGEKTTISYYTRVFMLTDDEAKRLLECYTERDTLMGEIRHLQQTHEVEPNRYTAEVEGFPPVAVVRHWTPGNGYKEHERLPVHVRPGGRLGIQLPLGMIESDNTRDLCAELIASYHPAKGTPIVIVDTGNYDNPIISGPAPYSGSPDTHMPSPRNAGLKGYAHIYLATYPVDELREKENKREAVEKEVGVLQSRPYRWKG